MSLATDVAAYKVTTDALITTQEDPNSISPAEVGGQLNALADLLGEYGAQSFTIHVESVAPVAGDGEDGDIWYYNTGSVVTVYQKVSGGWVNRGDLEIGVTFPDGPLTNLRTSIAGMVVTVQPGSWAISNTIYQKGSQTQFTLSAADLNFGRYDLIYANTSNQVLILAGTAASSPAIPTLPANCVMVDVAFIPSSSSGNPPYLLYGTTEADSSGKYVISKTEADLVATGAGDWYLEFTDSDGNDIPAAVKPYSIGSKAGTLTSPIAPMLWDDTGWAHPRIYGFPDKATAQTITIYAI